MRKDTLMKDVMEQKWKERSDQVENIGMIDHLLEKKRYRDLNRRAEIPRI